MWGYRPFRAARSAGPRALSSDVLFAASFRKTHISFPTRKALAKSANSELVVTGAVIVADLTVLAKLAGEPGPQCYGLPARA